MMKANLLTAMSDDQLWQLSCQGDREAFAQIVARYQPLVCSLAYSACGSLSRSEDLAQEAFIAAWERLGELRDPSRLRAWLCGIVRTRSANAARREQRRGGPAESLESAGELAAAEASPAEQAVTREEAALLWKSLEGLPEAYREPLILFYRQGRSVNEVARLLDISEETVRQRLTRGRSMVRDELASVVESVLTRTRPTAAFTLAVLAALPAVAPHPAEGALVAREASKTAVIKGLLSVIGDWMIAGPAIGALFTWFGIGAAAAAARSPQERACRVRHARRSAIFCWVMSIGLVLALLLAGKLQIGSPTSIVTGILAWVAILVIVMLWSASRLEREVARIRQATGTDDAAMAGGGTDPRDFSGPFEYTSKRRLLGLPMVTVRWSGFDQGTSRNRKATGWIALGDVAFSPLIAIGRVAIGPIALGGLTVGWFSFSLWGFAFGAFACGVIAVGWWAFGLGALGWKAAAGGAAFATDYALGMIARPAEANTMAAREWFESQLVSGPVGFLVTNANWVILLLLASAIGYRLIRGVWRPRRAR